MILHHDQIVVFSLLLFWFVVVLPKESVYFDDVPTLYCAFAAMAKRTAIIVIITFFIIVVVFKLLLFLLFITCVFSWLSAMPMPVQPLGCCSSFLFCSPFWQLLAFRVVHKHSLACSIGHRNILHTRTFYD